MTEATRGFDSPPEEGSALSALRASGTIIAEVVFLCRPIRTPDSLPTSTTRYAGNYANNPQIGDDDFLQRSVSSGSIEVF